MLKIIVVGADALMAKLSAIQKRLRDARKPMNESIAFVSQDIVDKTRGPGTDVKGERFKPLAVNTVASKAHFGYDIRPLIRTGGMVRETTFRRFIGSMKGRLWIPMREKVAYYMHFGTRPHVIRARRAPMLVFYTANGWVRKKSVNHPGTPPREWFGPRPGFEDRVQKTFADWLNGAMQG